MYDLVLVGVSRPREDVARVTKGGGRMASWVELLQHTCAISKGGWGRVAGETNGNYVWFIVAPPVDGETQIIGAAFHAEKLDKRNVYMWHMEADPTQEANSRLMSQADELLASIAAVLDRWDAWWRTGAGCTDDERARYLTLANQLIQFVDPRSHYAPRSARMLAFSMGWAGVECPED